MENTAELTNISPRQGRLRQGVGWTLTVLGTAIGIVLALGDSAIAARILPVAAIFWGTSWIFGGRAQICAVDATRGHEHPTELISFGMGGRRVEDEGRADAIRRVARKASVQAAALAVLLSVPVLLL